ncbi:Uncharacterised protein [Mycobacteroides abscessus subsp. abscessus]|nr:Uncharacterised protein [Mycobacteroides abscessus subsp. abscessus]
MDTRKEAKDRMVTSPPQASAFRWTLSKSRAPVFPRDSTMLPSGRLTMTPGCSTVWTNPLTPALPPTPTVCNGSTPTFTDGATPADPPICKPDDTSDWQPS